MTGSLSRCLRWSALILVFAAALSSRADADLWGHVRFGLDTLTTHALTLVDPYSFTQDKPWVNHEWLSEVQMAAAFRAFGPPGLQMLKAVLLSLVLAIVWSVLRRANLVVQTVALLSLLVGTIHMWATIRPQLWTLLAIAMLCRVLISGRQPMLWWLPPLFAIWANCHGGWVVGFAVLGIWAVGAVIENPKSLPIWAAVLAACVAGTLCNPYGVRLWWFLLDTVRPTRPIEEWLPLWTAPGLNWLPWAIGVGLLGLLRTRPSRWIGIGASLLLLAFWAVLVQRVESIFLLAASILLGPRIVETWPSVRRSIPLSPRAAVVGSAMSIVLCIALGSWFAKRSLDCIPIFGDWAPDRAIEGAFGNAPRGRIVIPFNWGEFGIWHWGPAVRVSIDGRRETVYSDETIDRNEAVVSGTTVGLSWLAQVRPEYVWLPSSSTQSRAWLLANGYRIEAETARSYAAVRSDVPLWPHATGLPRGCFPG